MADLSARWAALGLPRPRSQPLTEGARARQAHLAELRDVSGPSEAVRAGAEFSGERWLRSDLLGVRPWLAPDTPAREVVPAVLRAEWTGFLALLGDHGPWVYVPDVRALQELSGAYAALVTAARTAPESEVLLAAEQGHALGADQNLLVRLEATPYRQPTRPGADAARLRHLELAFWTLAGAQAQQARARWQARR
ncbi:hypothetical protein [Deinococcus radiotolerans]|uniref:Uncharacterized protein n=1 Tax=Deinococcus radiotolerans TaxID=1309407 RepID=A0ABQ2FHU3_9DEIO|nr:hypothetical protein [Deinococcus radiotolerans]GGK90697.1 hypothetical protein GCM10010844_06570 [Deinococcus radiotolerans]